MQRYFLETPYEAKERYNLSGETYHHMVRVMRMDIGQQVYLAFSDQTVIIAEIIQIEEDMISLKEVAKELGEKELPIQVTIACGYPKGDKLDWIIQKGTELGAHAFIGFTAKNSVVKWDHKKRQKKNERLSKIALEAAEQSHRQYSPEVTLLDKEQELLELFDSYDAVAIAYEESAKKGERSQFATIISNLNDGDRLLLIFGPEGGFTNEEILSFQRLGGKMCGLGPRIMRAETAPMYALSAISYQKELI
ncbi:16S rRNA (uracil(1498)-N(3))-methyltransferase [Enterococcus sp. LJL99]